jgi:hypothetical protein
MLIFGYDREFASILHFKFYTAIPLNGLNRLLTTLIPTARQTVLSPNLVLILSSA